jgi:PBSX family phage terminase large subunit
MGFSFVLWAMTTFDRQNFALCGKTIASFRRNVLGTLKKQLKARGHTVTEKRTDNLLVVSKGDKANLFYIFGGKDESSQDLIQGITLAGVFFDEVALMPESFVNQATARCSVTGSKFWFNCNPEGPFHWFYVNWIRKSKDRKLLYLHFTMEDNLTLSEVIKERYVKQYVGVFFDRYIRGLWVLAEGLIYPVFNSSCISKTEPREYSEYVVSMDYGIQNATSMGLWGKCGPIWYRVKEFYHSGRDTGKQKTDQDYYEELERLVGDLPVRKVIIDPSATSFIALIHQKKRFVTWRANNAVIDGIQHTASCLQDGTIKINDCCVNAIREFGLYRWDEKKTTKDEPVKENDHAMDEIRYFVNTTGVWRKKTPYQSIFVTG